MAWFKNDGTVGFDIEANTQKADKQIKKLFTDVEKQEKAVNGNFFKSLSTKQIDQCNKAMVGLTKSTLEFRNALLRKEDLGLLAPTKTLISLRQAVKNAGKEVSAYQEKIEKLKANNGWEQENQEAITLSNNIDKFKEKLQGYKQALAEANANKNWGNAKEEIAQIEENIRKTKTVLDILYKQLDETPDFVLTKEAKALQEAMDNAGLKFANLSERLEEAESNLENFKDITTDTKDGIRDFSINLSNASGSARDLTSGVRTISSAFGTIRRNVSNAGKSLFNFAKTSTSGLNIGLKRVLAYALGIRTLFTAIQKLKAFATEGFGNLSKAGGETQKNVENLSASLQYFKNALGSAIAPIYNTVAPALSKFIDMLAEAVNAFAKFIAVLTGKKLTVAKKSFEGIGSAIGGASGQAEELKRQLMGFDQIQKLDDIADSLGGGGSGGTNYGDMFTVEETDEAVNKWAELVKKSWAEADFTEIGSIVGTKIENALTKIPWEKMQNTAGKIGSSVATFLNGAIEGDNGKNWGIIGNTFAQGLNTAFTFGYNFVDKFNWKQFGDRINKEAQGFFDGIDWEKIKNTAKKTGEGVANSLKSVFEDKTLFAKAGTSFSNAVNSLIETGYSFIKTLGSNNGFRKFGESVGTFIGNAIGGIEWDKVGTGIHDAVWGIFDALGGAIETIPWEDLGEKVAELIGNIDIPDLIIKALVVVEGLAEGVDEFNKGLVAGFNEHTTGVNGTSGIVTQADLDAGKGGWKEMLYDFFHPIESSVKAIEGVVVGDAVKTSASSVKDVANQTKMLFDVQLTPQGKETVDRINETKNKNVKIEADGSMTVGFRTMEDNYTSVRSNTATKTATGKTDKSYTTVRNSFVSTDWSKVAKATKTIFGKTDKSFTTNRNEYNKVGNSSATKSLLSKWYNGSKWDRDIAEYNAVKDKTATVTLISSNKINGRTGNYTLTMNKDGGAFVGGSWRSIPQYASGGIPSHGSLFIAGEHGSEAVANIGGRTEVLNRSQFGSAIASGVSRTLSRVRIPNPAPQLAFVERQIAQQGVQQQQTDSTVIKLLTAILGAISEADRDVYFDTVKVTNEIVKTINRETRATGVVPILI